MEPNREPEKEVHEPGGRKRQRIEDMSSENLAAAYGDATRLRSHAIAYTTDATIGHWMDAARAELNKRGHLDLIREHLPVYFDPSRTPAVFGPGAPAGSQAATEHAVTPRALKTAG